MPPQRPVGAPSKSFARRPQGGKPTRAITVDSREDARVAENSFAAKKLAYDELLRHQRGRAEDMAKLLAFGSRDLAEKKNESAAFRKTAGFREEWRIGE